MKILSLMIGVALLLNGCGPTAKDIHPEHGYKTYNSGSWYKNKETGVVSNIWEDKSLLKIEVACRELTESLFRKVGQSYDLKGIQIETDNCLDRAGYERVDNPNSTSKVHVPPSTTTSIVPPSGTVWSAGQIWMDRNLGASRVAFNSADAAAYGDLYQWGRGADGHQLRTSGTTSTLSSTDDPGHGDFITAVDSPYDWRSPQNHGLWQGVSGINNPCPPGFRLPTSTELEIESTSWRPRNSQGAYLSPLKLPLVGYRQYFSANEFQIGNQGFYWSSTIDNANAIYLTFTGTNAILKSFYRSSGFAVRCIFD